MKVVIIAAGYATRMYPITLNTPKPLLPIGDSTILSLLMEKVSSIIGISECIIVSNHKFINDFKDWRDNNKRNWLCSVKIMDDGTENNDERLGAVRDLLLVIEKYSINEDILVLAADNLIEFSLVEFVNYAQEKNVSCIMYHEEKSIEKLQRTGVIIIDNNKKVLDFQEKPLIPNSHFAVPPFYYIVSSDIPLIKECIENSNEYDALGNLAQYIYKHSILYAWSMNGRRIDIGDLKTYKKISKDYNQIDLH